MDLMAALRFVMDHNQNVIGALIVIILATVGLLFARMVGQEKAAPASRGTGAASDLDLGAIESAFKRVLAAQGGASTVAGSSHAASAGVAVSASGDGTDRDAKMQELAREIDRLTAELAEKSSSTGFGGTVSPVGTGSAVTAGSSGSGGGADASVIDELRSKIEELEGKLTEYEIIEDDIADLSRFKEENAELRGELEALKNSMTSAPPNVDAKPSTSEPVVAAAPPAAPAAESAGVTPSLDSEADAILAQLEAESVKLAPATDASAAAVQAPPVDENSLGAQVAALIAEDRAEKAAPFQPAVVAKVDGDEAALKEFASNIEIQKSEAAAAATKVDSGSDLNFAVAAAALSDGSSILDASVDTEKLLSEVSTLTGESDEHALSAEVDTTKLLSEADAILAEAGVGPAASPVAAPTAVAPAPVAPKAAAPTPALVDAGEDDLLAEFKDENDGGHG